MLWRQKSVNSSKTELFRSSSKEFENSDNFARWLTDTPIGEGKTSQLGSTYKFKRSNSSQKLLTKTTVESLHPSNLSLSRAKQSLQNWNIERKSSLTNLQTEATLQPGLNSMIQPLNRGFEGLISACKAKRDSLENSSLANSRINLAHHLMGNQVVSLVPASHKICYRSVKASRFKTLGKEVIDKSRHDRMLLGHLNSSATQVLNEMNSARKYSVEPSLFSQKQLRRGNSLFLSKPTQSSDKLITSSKSSAKLFDLTANPIEIPSTKKPLGWHLFDKSRCVVNTRVKDRISTYQNYLQTRAALL